MDLDPAVTGNHGGSKRGEKGAIRRALRGARFVLPAHDRPAVVEHGRVVGRAFDRVPGPVIPNDEFPGKLTADSGRRRPPDRARKDPHGRAAAMTDGDDAGSPPPGWPSSPGRRPASAARSPASVPVDGAGAGLVDGGWVADGGWDRP